MFTGRNNKINFILIFIQKTSVYPNSCTQILLPTNTQILLPTNTQILLPTNTKILLPNSDNPGYFPKSGYHEKYTWM